MTRARLCDWVLRLAWDRWVPGNIPCLVDLTCLLTISISSFVSCLFILLACLLTRLFDFFFVCVEVGWGQHWASWIIFPFLFLRQHPSVNLKCIYSARLASHELQGSDVSISLVLGSQMGTATPGFYVGIRDLNTDHYVRQALSWPLNCLIVYSWIFWVLQMFWILLVHQVHDLPSFLSSCILSFHLVNCCCCCSDPGGHLVGCWPCFP